jgi:hypothetical protein
VTGYFVKQDVNSRPICPKDGVLITPGYDAQVDRHTLWVEIQNEVYEEYKPDRDADGELPASREESYKARITELAEQRLGTRLRKYDNDCMQLYVATAEPGHEDISGMWRQRQYFTTAWLRCPICLFVLPGQVTGW